MKKVLLSILFGCIAFAMNSQVKSNDPKMDRFIDDLMGKMTIEEKIGQLNLPSSGDITTRNDGDQQNNPADMDVFDSYMYGSKKITVDNKILSLRVRSHNADDASPTYFGVQVVDLSAANPVAEKVGETRTHGSEVYGDYHFDLSAYVGKEVIVAIGVYRKETGDYWKQLPIARIAFAQQNVTGWDWIPGFQLIFFMSFFLRASYISPLYKPD